MKGNNGEHPFGDSVQLILLVLFLLIWAVDSFILKISTFFSDQIPLTIRLVILGLLLSAAVYLVRAGHGVVHHEQRPSGVVSTGAFGCVRHPLYLGSILFYLGLVISTASLISFTLVVLIFIFYDYIASPKPNHIRIPVDFSSCMFPTAISSPLTLTYLEAISKKTSLIEGQIRNF